MAQRITAVVQVAGVYPRGSLICGPFGGQGGRGTNTREMTTDSSTILAILGTGAVGSRLGVLLSAAGHTVIFGGRDPADRGRLPATARLVGHREAVAAADLAIVAVPWAGESGWVALDVVEGAGPWDGKILVDATNPLRADWSPLSLGPETSGGETMARAVPGARVVKAFNTIFADMMVPETLRALPVAPALMLCGDDPAARARVAALGRGIGLDPVDLGPLSCARYLEAIAHANIQLAVAMQGGTRAAFAYVRPA